MDQSPLVNEEIDAGAELISKFGDLLPVKATFWLKPAEDESWILCIASNQINEETFDLGYGEILRLTHQMQNPNVDPFRVRLIPGDDRLALAAVAINRDLPRPIGTRVRGYRFGDEAIAGAYIYPDPTWLSSAS